jgi:manganese oxidase
MSADPPSLYWSRRQILQASLGGLGLAAIAACQRSQPPSAPSAIRVPAIATGPTYGNAISPLQMVRDFDYGTVKQENGRTVREFRLTAGTTTLQLNSTTNYITWNYNQRVPGPTLRATAGDLIRVLFLNQGGHAHTMHFHGIHPTAMDGIRPVANGQAFIYEFEAQPYGVHPYHCHIAPVTRHISKGLHGLFIIDPPGGRPPADELVLVMAGYDLNGDGRNELYAFNGLPNCYLKTPIPIYQHQLTRIYLLNMIEFDPAVTFHLHANFFQIYPTGMTLTPSHRSDVITMGTAERHVLEFTYDFPGRYMFHPHQDAIAEAGCMGNFEVLASAN